ncbi:hypothetical protein [Spiroplasma phoeniceum]|uniref:Uncharacterized protein n=1 Tax=Spiroplasma phoeniceum P40 TaxID=1276259 RepID=A0A345DMT3_9MOLU|nr:hypothetical protein [Spiroplasma phoeniceum]AXF95521.1 hypothetical protein SDAV_00527 [Spiroplasma phoeniceum P40]
MHQLLTGGIIIEYSIDLNWSENNCNFNIDILAKVFIKKFCKPFSWTAVFKILTGAKGFGKSYLFCLLALFFPCNFTDWNSILARYQYNSARDNFDKKITRVINDLEKFGVTIKEAIKEKIIKVTNNDNRFEYKWPNGRIIKIVGFDNSSTWEGQEAPVGEYGFLNLMKSYL